jgi:mono/diheme cytochrome c family protein
MKDLRTGIVVWLVAATAAFAQAPVAAPPAPPPMPQLPMGIRPIRVPQLAPIAPVVQSGPEVQTPLAPPPENQGPRFAPAGINGRPGAPFAPAPGQPLQPIHRIGTPQNPIIPAYNPPPVATQPPSYLAWDSERKETNIIAGQTSATFSFWLTNVSPEVVTINSIRTSCGCTIAKLPTMPWKLDPGVSGEIPVTMNLAGKMGSIEKAVMIDGTTGSKTLIVRVNMAPPAGQPVAASGGIDPDRIKNMQMALADRQVVFKGECAKCHAEPAANKMGEQLYVAACGICHDSPHRAAMVPDLKNLRHPTNEEHWRKWTRSGRPGSMMPSFAKNEGGPLTDEQIESLVKFLTDTITAKAKPVNSVTPAATSAQVQPATLQNTASAAPAPKANVQ